MIEADSCSKCFTKTNQLVKYTNSQESWELCQMCNTAFDCPVTLIREFLKEDFGQFPVPQVTKNMINARKRRALGDDPWKKSPENFEIKTKT